MGKFIRSDDLKRIFTGASLAVLAGLLLGGAVQPPLSDGLLAPQQEWAGGGARNNASVPEPGVSAYAANVPDYVVGTNYTQAPPMADRVMAHEERAEPAAYDIAEHAQTAEATAPTRWEDEPHEAPIYPSQSGNAYNPSDLPEPPEPPVDLFDPA
jgi:hypothetical protein